MNLWFVLEAVDAMEKQFWMWYLIIGIILFLPWVGLLIYCLTLKYRIRVFSNGILVGTFYFKKGQEIDLKEYQNAMLFLDEDLTEEFTLKEMPSQNLKVYIKH